MKRLLLLLFLLPVCPLWSQVISTAPSPEVAGFSTKRLARLDSTLSEWIENKWAPGISALIIHEGKIVYYKAKGIDDLQSGKALDKNAIYRIASQTKAITSVAIMMLYEEGKLLLDDPVSKYIPAFAKQSVLDKFNAADTTYTTIPAKKEVTIRELLTHTSGIGYAQIGSRESNAIYAKHHLTAGIGVQDDKLLDAMNRLAALPLMHQPGEKWTYGLNSDLLGCLVEVISGMSLDRFFASRLFQPLGMVDTYFRIPSSKASRLVQIYREDNAGRYTTESVSLLNSTAPLDYPLQQQTYFSGGAGLSSTIFDYAKFLQMLLNGGKYNGVRILSRNSVRMMITNQIGDLPFRLDDKFGLGFQLVTEKSSGRTAAQAGTFSWGGAFATSYWVDPKEKLVMLFYRQLQYTSHTDLPEKFRALVYAALE